MRRILTVLVIAGGLAPRAAGTQTADRDSLAATLDALRTEAGMPALPAADAFTRGPRAVTGTVGGPVAVFGGPLTIAGTVEGDAVAVGSDIILEPGATVRGNAIALGGAVVGLAGATVAGEVRAVTGQLAPTPLPAARPSLAGRVSVVLGAGLIALALALGALAFAGDRLTVVADEVASRFGVAFWSGLLAQLAVVPVLLLLVIGLVATILGILLVPFAVVAYVAAVAGLVVLGLLAVARRVGATLTREGDAPSRGAALRSVVVGVAALVAVWLGAVLAGVVPPADAVLRVAAIALTWTAATVGLGAAVVTRAGSRGRMREGAPAPTPAAGWQTPTPVGGVVAARRPRPPAGVTGALLACALVVPGVAGAQWQVLSVSRAGADTLPVDVRVRFGAGRLGFAPAPRGTLYAIRLRYDVDRLTAVHRFDPAARTLVVGTAARPGRAAVPRRGEGAQLDVAVGPGTPLALDVEAGAVDGTLDLGGLTLDRATIATGAAELRVRVSAPLARPARELRFEVGAADFVAEELGNAGAADIHLTLGAGSASLDFGGAWPVAETVLHVRAALGELALAVPRDVGLHLEMNRFGTDLSTAGLVKRDGAWVSDNWDSATRRLRIRASTALVGVKLTRGA